MLHGATYENLCTMGLYVIRGLALSTSPSSARFLATGYHLSRDSLQLKGAWSLLSCDPSSQVQKQLMQRWGKRGGAGLTAEKSIQGRTRRARSRRHDEGVKAGGGVDKSKE